MTTFYAAPDADREPTIFARDQITLDPFTQRDVAVLRRCDLHPERRRFWDELVERMTGEGLLADLRRVKNAVDAR